MMSDKGPIIGDVRGSRQLLEQAHKGISEMWENEESIFSGLEISTIESEIRIARKMLTDISRAMGIYRKVINAKGNGAPTKNAGRNLSTKKQK